MGKRFIGNPEVLRKKAVVLTDMSDQFQKNVNRVYQIINDILTNHYISPEMKVIVREIEKSHDDLNNMAKIIGEYGSYSGNAGTTIFNNQSSIASSYTNKS